MKEKESELVALFDMDGTLCDFNKSLLENLNAICSPKEIKLTEKDLNGNLPTYLFNRRELILRNQSFWENLERFSFGWDVINLTSELGYKNMILTQAPRDKPSSLSGKLIWLQKNFSGGIDFTMTRDKGLVYGKVLVDDYPEYIGRWLEWRTNGLVIMPANGGNKHYYHPNVIRYDGKNISEVKRALEIAKIRKGGESLNL